MTSYQCYGRADFSCPVEESKDLFVSISELFGLVFGLIESTIKNKKGKEGE